MAFKNYDSPLYFRTARQAAQFERSGEYQRAAKIWNKAHRLSRNYQNQRWSEHRSDFCFMQMGREKVKNDLRR